MTFRHTNFEDSQVMRSLERLAQEKGLIKNDPLQKIASAPAKPKKANLKPTNNLTENLLKLCAGLREEGMIKYAEELEATFMMYKQASCECDHDLIDSAHPKGSHKLEGVMGDAVIETILDQHLAMMKTVEKKPTGKLSTAEDILNAVKISLATDFKAKIDDALAKIQFNLNRVFLVIENSPDNKELTNWNIQRGKTYAQSIAREPAKIKVYIKNLTSRLTPNWAGMGLSDDTWSKVKDLLSDADTQATSAVSYFIEQRIQDSESNPGDEARRNELRATIDQLKKKIISWDRLMTEKENKEWFSKELVELNKIYVIPNLEEAQAKLLAEKLDIDDFERMWVNEGTMGSR